MRLDYLYSYLLRSTHSPVRQFDKNGELVAFFGMDKEKDPLLCDKAFLNRILENAKADYPVIYLEKYPIYYGIVEDKEIVYVIGPIIVDYDSRVDDGRKCSEYIAKTHNTKEEGHRVSYCSYENFCEEVLLLYNFLKDSNMTYQELNSKNYLDEELLNDTRKKIGQLFFNYQEHEKVHNPYDREKREMESIRSGDIEKLKKSINEVFDGEYAILSKDKLQASKNLGIVGLAISCRAAIEGGMLPEEAFSVSDSYILKVDESNNIGRIEAIVQQAKIDFTTRVQKENKKNKENPLVEQCKKLIFKNMHRKIEVRDLAEHLNITPEYLSTLFRKEEGICLQDYIRKEKIQLTENLLVYSEYSIEEISNYFGFCSQSHFGKIFKKITNMTPKEFRDRYGVKDFSRKYST